MVTSVVAGDSPAKCVAAPARLSRQKTSFRVRTSYQGIASALPKAVRKQTPFQGLPTIGRSTLSSGSEHVYV